MNNHIQMEKSRPEIRAEWLALSRGGLPARQPGDCSTRRAMDYLGAHPEVTQLHLPSCVHQHVGRLHICQTKPEVTWVILEAYRDGYGSNTGTGVTITGVIDFNRKHFKGMFPLQPLVRSCHQHRWRYTCPPKTSNSCYWSCRWHQLGRGHLSSAGWDLEFKAILTNETEKICWNSIGNHFHKWKHYV